MEIQVRNSKQKLVGIIDRRANTFTTADGRKRTSAHIPREGLTVEYDSGNGISERIYIPYPGTSRADYVITK